MLGNSSKHCWVSTILLGISHHIMTLMNVRFQKGLCLLSNVWHCSQVSSVVQYRTWDRVTVLILLICLGKATLHLTKLIFFRRQINQNNTVTPSQVLYCTPEDAWEQFQTLLSKHNPFWNLTSYHDTYGVSERRSSVLFVSVSFIVLMVISITWLVLYYVQRFRYIHAKDRMERRLCVQAKRALAIIPIITISKDEDEDEDHCPGKISKNILVIKPKFS